MATLNDPSSQGFSGKIGGRVFYSVGNKTYARELANNASTRVRRAR